MIGVTAATYSSVLYNVACWRSMVAAPPRQASETDRCAARCARLRTRALHTHCTRRTPLSSCALLRGICCCTHTHLFAHAALRAYFAHAAHHTARACLAHTALRTSFTLPPRAARARSCTRHTPALRHFVPRIPLHFCRTRMRHCTHARHCCTAAAGA